MSGKTLYRSRSQRMIVGVCGGLGAYFGIDPTLVRLAFVFASLLGFAGPLILTYIVLFLIVPQSPLESVSTTSAAAEDIIDVTPSEQA